jgi:hypothetical protein
LRRVKGRSTIARRVVVRSEYNDANHVPNVTHDESKGGESDDWKTNYECED